MSDSRNTGAGSGLTPESFELLLDWLDPDQERAARKYEVIRRGLIVMFENRRCLNAEDLADETIDRVARKVSAIMDQYQGDPARYFYGVANYIFREQARQKLAAPPPPPAEDTAETELMHECLAKCMGTLSPASRELILRYFAERKRAKITRKELASKLDMPVNALRVRVHRIRNALHTCIEECMSAREE